MSIESLPLLTFPQGQDLCLACSLLGQAPRTVRYASGTSSPTVEQVKGVWIKRTVSYERETRLLIPAGLPASVIGRPPMDERRGELKGQPGRVAWRRAAEAGPGPRAVWWRGLCSSCSVPCVQRGQLCAPALSGGSGAWTQALSSPGPPTVLLSLPEPLWLGIENRCWEIRLKGVWPKYLIQGYHFLGEFSCVGASLLLDSGVFDDRITCFHSQFMWVSFLPGNINILLCQCCRGIMFGCS